MIKIKVVRNKQELRFEYFADLSSLGTIFMVAASRMGNMVTPKWCFSDVPFDMTLADENRLNASDSTSWFVVTMRIKTNSTTMIVPYINKWDNVACESL